MTPWMEEQAKKTLEYQKLMMQDLKSRVESCLSHASIIGFPDDPNAISVVAITADAMRTPEMKDGMMFMFMRMMIEQRARGFVFAFPALFSKEMTDEERAQLPDSMNDWPEEMTVEAVVVCVNQIGQRGRAGKIDYWFTDGKIQWGTFKWFNETFQSRFLADLTMEHLQEILRMKAVAPPGGHA